MLLIFVPKFQLIYFGSQEDLDHAAETSKTSSNTTAAAAYSTPADDGHEEEIASLKTQIAKLEAENLEFKKKD